MAEENTPEPGELPKEPDLSESDPTLAEGASTSGAIASSSERGSMTPGQRLAARKAQKAIEKRESKEERQRAEEVKRQQETEEAERLMGRAQPEPALPQNVERAAGTFTHFLQDNRDRIVMSVVGALALAGIVFGAQRLLRAGAAEQAVQLGQALAVANAPIDPEDSDGKTDDGKPVFKSEQERASKALAAFAGVVAVDKERPAGHWAQLGAAAAEVTLGKLDDARKHFQSVYDARASDPVLAARALEGVAVSLEAAGKSDEALKTFEKLKAVDGSQELASYHIARLKLAKGDQEGGKALLKSLYEQLNKPSEAGAPRSYLKGEVEVRLAEIDSSLVDRGPAGLPGMGGDGTPQIMDEAQIQRLIEQLSKKGKPGAGTE